MTWVLCTQTARSGVPCPVCDGRGEVPATLGQPGDGPMPCPRCSRSGARDFALEALIAYGLTAREWNQPDDEHTRLQLRAVLAEALAEVFG